METYLGTDVDIHEVGVKIAYDGLGFIFPLTFLFFFSFIFLYIEQLRLGLISHTVTSVTT